MKNIMRITLMACIGLVFIVGGMLSTFGVHITSVFAQTSEPTMHTLTVDSNIALLNDELLRIRVVSKNSSVAPVEHFGARPLQVESGSTVSIIGGSDRFMEFLGFDLTGSGTAEKVTSEHRFDIASDVEVTAMFRDRILEYALTISGRTGGIDIDEDGNSNIGVGGLDVPLGDSISVSIDGGVNSGATIFGFTPMQTLNSITFDGIAGHKLDSLSIKLRVPNGDARYMNFVPVRVEGKTYIFDETLDVNFFDQFLSLSSEIIIVLELTKLHKLEIVTSGASGGLASLTVKRGGVEINNFATDNLFEPTEEFEITVSVKDHFEFLGFDRPVGNTAPRILSDKLVDDRIITLHVRAVDYDMVSIGADKATASTSFRVGQVVMFTYEVPANNAIKSWKIRNLANGFTMTVPKKDIGANGITVTLTSEMISGGKFDLQHDVDVSLKDELMFAIVGAGTALPILIIMLLGFMIMNAKRKKVIKAQLEGKRALKMKRDVGGYIADLRSGADTGKITKEQIKAEMKRQKQEKTEPKAKPQVIQKAAVAPAAPQVAPVPVQRPTVVPVPKPESAPQPAPQPAQPVQPAPAPVPRLAGTKMTHSRTIVDSGGNVVATLLQDGSIADKTGKVFAKIRMTDGAIVGLDNRVLGVVQGDGSIR